MCEPPKCENGSQFVVVRFITIDICSNFENETGLHLHPKRRRLAGLPQRSKCRECETERSAMDSIYGWSHTSHPLTSCKVTWRERTVSRIALKNVSLAVYQRVTDSWFATRCCFLQLSLSRQLWYASNGRERLRREIFPSDAPPKVIAYTKYAFKSHQRHTIEIECVAHLASRLNSVIRSFSPHRFGSPWSLGGFFYQKAFS